MLDIYTWTGKNGRLVKRGQGERKREKLVKALYIPTTTGYMLNSYLIGRMMERKA